MFRMVGGCIPPSPPKSATAPGHGHILELATQKCLCPHPGSFVKALDGFSALLFVPLELELLAGIKKKRFYTAFYPSFSA